MGFWLNKSDLIDDIIKGINERIEERKENTCKDCGTVGAHFCTGKPTPGNKPTIYQREWSKNELD
jgi:hypothetical protein